MSRSEEFAKGTKTGTRKALGISYGDRITVHTPYQGLVTGTVVPRGSGWALADRDVEGHLPPFGHATKVTIA